MTTAEMLYLAAHAAWRDGDPHAALAVAQAGLRLDADHARLHELVGLVQYDFEDFAKAVHALESASTLAPLGVEGQLALADCYLRFGQVQAAHAILEFLALAGRCPPPLLPRVARGLGQLGAYEQALEVCEWLTELRPTSHAGWFGVAYYKVRLEEPTEEVLYALQMAHELAPESVTYRVSLASAYLDVGHWKAAHALIRDLPAEAIGCPLMVNRFIRVFAEAGDSARVREYEARFVRMAEGNRRRGGCSSCSPDDEEPPRN